MVKAVDASGAIRLCDGRIIPPSFRMFVRGFAVTSYGSQGKTVDYVVFSDSGVAAATNNRQWLVTISRGRKGVQLFTGDKNRLREQIAQPGEREIALDHMKEINGQRKFRRMT